MDIIFYFRANKKCPPESKLTTFLREKNCSTTELSRSVLMIIAHETDAAAAL